MTLDIALLGPPVITVEDAPLSVDTRKATALLAYLASEHGPIPRDTAALLLWPDYSQERSRAALRRTLSSLRKGLGGRWIVTSRAAIELDEKGVSVDLDRFDRLATSKRGKDRREAAALYRGDFMAGFSLRDSPQFDDWQANRAAYYRMAAAAVMERVSEDAAAWGDFVAAIAHARRWLDLDRLHEPAHRALMRYYALGGDRTSAIQQYQACVAVLEEELGVAPLTETTELYHDIAEGRLHPVPGEPRRPRKRLPKAARLRTAFVGRERALEGLQSAYLSADMNMVAIVGEPGIGKTRLAEEYVARIPTGTPVIRGSAQQTGTSTPFAVMIQALRSGLSLPRAAERLNDLDQTVVSRASLLVPELAAGSSESPSLESPGRQALLIESTCSVLLSLAEGGVILLDDLQWADPDSVAVISAIVRRQEPMLILALYRDTQLSASDPLPTLAREGARRGFASAVKLDRLTKEDISELVEGHGGDEDLSEAIYRLSEGVPYFAMEYLLAARVGPTSRGLLPAGVRDLLTDRTAALRGLARQALAAGSVLGRSFSLDDVRFVSGRSRDETFDAMEELLSEGLVRETADPDIFDFDHDRLRQFVYEGLTALRRRRLNSRAADLILARTSLDPSLSAAAAEYLEAAGRLDEAAEQHYRAGVHATMLFANQTAIDHLDAALALGHHEKPRIHESIADLQVLGGQYGKALSSLRAALSTAAGTDAARMEHKMGMIHAWAGEWDHAEAHLMSASERMESDPARIHLWVDWAWVAHRRGRPAQAADLAWRALKEAEESESNEALAQAHNILGILARPSDPDASERHLVVALERADDLQETVRAAALNNLALARLSGGRPEQGLAPAAEALDTYDRVGDKHKAAAVHSNLADLLHATGRDDEAEDHQREAAAIFTQVGLDPGSLEPEIWKLTEW